MSLIGLANALTTRFSQNSRFGDIDEAITLHQEALTLRPTPHPDRTRSLSALAHSLGNKFLKLRNFPDLEAATMAFRAAVKYNYTPASQRFHAARLWARHADAYHESALEAYQAAIKLLPQLAVLDMDLQSRQEVLLSRSNGLACNAAACAI